VRASKKLHKLKNRSPLPEWHWQADLLDIPSLFQSLIPFAAQGGSCFNGTGLRAPFKRLSPFTPT
jgi:hypothetical protein